MSVEARAVQRLNDHGLGSRLLIIGDTLTLAALTRRNFNDGQPIEIFHVTVVDGVVLRGSLDDALDRFCARMQSDQGPSEISALDVYRRQIA